MTTFVFLGPTLSHVQAKPILDAIYLEPARTGDIYRVSQHKPDAILLIDGYFDRVPTVWHKEILWAMKQGVHVFGAASMGALRAVELSLFGMEGIGQIYADFAAGLLEDDDEVAVAHTFAEEGYLPTSVAMVDIRATLRHATQEAVITHEQQDILLEYTKSLYYPDRNYQSIAQRIRQRDFDNADDIVAWIDKHKVHQKMQDAIAALRLVAERFQKPQPAKAVTYSFNNTDMWSNLVSYAGRASFNSMSRHQQKNDSVLDELRLDLKLFHNYRRLTLLQLCADYILKEDEARTENSGLQNNLATFFRQRQIALTDINHWIARNYTTPQELNRIINTYAKIDVLNRRWHQQILDTLPDVLKLSGIYQQLVQRASEKETLLRSHYMDVVDANDVGMDTEQLYHWYFIDYKNMPAIPDDIQTYALTSGFVEVRDFKRVILREYCFNLLNNNNS